MELRLSDCWSDGSQMSPQQEPVRLSPWTRTAVGPAGPWPGRRPAAPVGRDRSPVPGGLGPPAWTVSPRPSSATIVIVIIIIPESSSPINTVEGWLMAAPLLPQFTSSGGGAGATWRPVWMMKTVTFWSISRAGAARGREAESARPR